MERGRGKRFLGPRKTCVSSYLVRKSSQFLLRFLPLLRSRQLLRALLEDLLLAFHFVWNRLSQPGRSLMRQRLIVCRVGIPDCQFLPAVGLLFAVSHCSSSSFLV